MPGNGAQVQPGTRDLTTPTAACASDSHDFRNEIEDVDALGESSASESELVQHTLEVIFDGQDSPSPRRKSSIPSLAASKVAQQKAEKRREVACSVHKLLEKQRQDRKYGSSLDLKNIGDDGELDGEGASSPSRTAASRLLTKKQLAEMAWSVRRLSKKLTSIRLKLNVRTVFLLTKAHDEDLIGFTRGVAEWLLSTERDRPYTVYVEKTLEHNHRFDAAGLLKKDPSNEGRLKYWTTELCRQRPQTFDFVVTLGGDGTVLYASWLFQKIVPPVLSFALGSLGFLTKFDYHDFQNTLTSAFCDGVTVSLRLRFEGTVMRSQPRDSKTKRDLVEELIGEECDNNHTHKPDGRHEILNDIVVDRGPNATMSAIELFGDDEHFTTVQADGICVATPTGSTAYNLAAGGSLCHPENPVILVTAICAHTLSFRPIILPDTIVLRVGVPYDARGSNWASFDGRERVELKPGDYVTISASRFPFANVLPGGRRSEDWINSIRRTLQWNSRQRQKGFKEWEEGD